MYDFGARMYDPALGRWHCLDPMAEKYWDLSPYHYVKNNPLMYVDPNGMEGWGGSQYSSGECNYQEYWVTKPSQRRGLAKAIEEKTKQAATEQNLETKLNQIAADIKAGKYYTPETKSETSNTGDIASGGKEQTEQKGKGENNDKIDSKKTENSNSSDLNNKKDDIEKYRFGVEFLAGNGNTINYKLNTGDIFTCNDNEIKDACGFVTGSSYVTVGPYQGKRNIISTRFESKEEIQGKLIWDGKKSIESNKLYFRYHPAMNDGVTPNTNKWLYRSITIPTGIPSCN